tara:strand:+ start:140 stop:742 length:603 start_codon:yes stop_codon:yes gene_type:complete
MSEINKSVTVSSVTSSTLPSNVYLIPQRNATDINTLSSGDLVLFGTVTGDLPVEAAVPSGITSTYTFKLPTPVDAGERIELYPTNNVAIDKPVGFVCNDPSSERITFRAHLGALYKGNTAPIFSNTTIAGNNGETTTMVKITNKTLRIGDTIKCVSLSSNMWLMDIKSGELNQQLDFAHNKPSWNANVDCVVGHADGYIE